MTPPLGEDRPRARLSRARLLTAASTLFGRQGVNATSINELRAEARVSKRTLYQHFVSKDELVLAYLAQSEQTSAAHAVLAREQLAPRARLLELFTTLAERPRPLAPDPFVAVAIEFPDPEHPVHQAAAHYGQRLTARLCELARDAGARRPDRVGRQLALLYTGAASQAMLDDPTEVVTDAYALAAAILRDAID